MSKSVVILSGGMDSTVVLYDVLNAKKMAGGGSQDVHALSFNYGQRHGKELEAAKATCQALDVFHQIVDISQIGRQLLKGSSLTDDIEVPHGHYAEESMKLTVVPNRNMIMLSLALGYGVSIKADAVYYGAHAGDHAIYPDCRSEFVEAMQKVAHLCDWHQVKLYAPYIDLDKGDIAIKGLELEVDFSKTWTCYEGGEKACGKCGACGERILAFDKANAVDPMEYAQSWEVVLADAKKMLEKEG